MTHDHQQAILTAMGTADFYPHPVGQIERRETHISTVFLTGPFVYKIKKPVNLGFLDFSSIDKRRRCCADEVTLNRRLSRGVYLEVLPITVHNGRYALGGAGDIVEYSVKMRQLADADTMAQRLATGRLEAAALDDLAERLVAFHRHAAVDISPQEPESSGWEENLDQVIALAPGMLDPASIRFVEVAARSFFQHHRQLFQRRRQTGKIREVHGDLRCDHIYFTTDGLQIIDCIEFSRSLRTLDTINDLAFLLMDLTARHFVDQARWLLRQYIERTMDLEAMPLLDFYCCYRALVRCKVACLRLKEKSLSAAAAGALQASACSYLAMAHGYAEAFSQPRMWILCGLPASGKSTIAAALADLLGIGVIRSDLMRRQLFPDTMESPDQAPFAEGRYSAYASEVTYRQMLATADEKLKQGQSVILDATFSRSLWRRQARKLADARQALPVLVECRIDEQHLVDRLNRRAHHPSVSEARLIHLPGFKQRFEPVAPAESLIHITVDTKCTPAACLRRIVLDEQLLAATTGQGGASCLNESSSQPI